MAKSAEEATFVVDKEEVYKINKQLVNTNTMADPPVLDLNGNILATDEEKPKRWREHFEFVLNHDGSREVPLLQTLFHQLMGRVKFPFCFNHRNYFTS